MAPWIFRFAGPALAVLVLVACGSSTGGGTPGATSSSSSSVTPPEDLTVSSGPTTPAVTVTGVVSEGVESGCLLFTPTDPARGGVWLLVGNTRGIGAGDTVTVRGTPAPGLMTTCQQGTPFRVEALVAVVR